MRRVIGDTLICPPFKSRTGIKLSLEIPLDNAFDLNITRPAVLGQYYSKVMDDRILESNISECILMDLEVEYLQQAWIPRTLYVVVSFFIHYIHSICRITQITEEN